MCFDPLSQRIVTACRGSSVTILGTGHFVEQDAPDMVNKTMRWWLLARTGSARKQTRCFTFG